MDAELRTRLIAAAEANPPLAYKLTTDSQEFSLLKQVFARDPKVTAILQQAQKGHPDGLIIFGYHDDRGMTPITHLLDAVQGLSYHCLTSQSGKNIYFMPHCAAQAYLPKPRMENIMEEKPGAFNLEIEQTLSAILADRRHIHTNATPHPRIMPPSNRPGVLST